MLKSERVTAGSDVRRSAHDNANDWLNTLVARKIDKLRATGEPLSAEVAWVAEHDHDVYQNRFKPLVILVLLGSAVGIAQAPTLAGLVLAFGLLYLLVDFYSGVLHVVLDNPRFVRLPLIGVPCVEFQWHHTFSHDISSRRLLDVWGDLNVLIAIKLSCLLLLGGVNRTTFMVAGVGFFWGYTNQWSHRLTHTAAARRPPIAKWLQRTGVLLDPPVHHVHHTDHGQSFPVLSGHTRGLVQWLLRVAPNQWVWLVGFCALTALDLAAVTWLLQAIGL